MFISCFNSINITISYKSITKILEKQSGTSKAGKEWSKQLFVVETNDEYNNLYCFEVFGVDKVDKLLKNNKVGDSVTVDFNVSTNEYQEKYYTSLQAWKIASTKIEEAAAKIDETFEPLGEEDDEMPF